MAHPTTEVIARLEPNPARRMVTAGMFYGVGALTLAGAMAQRPGAAQTVALLAIVAGCVYMGRWSWQATQPSLLFTEDGLFEEGGRQLASFDQIASVDRSTFSFKPTNGFLIRLTEKRPAAWAPGLWWRLGRSIGVGGVFSGAEARLMADQIALALVSKQAR